MIKKTIPKTDVFGIVGTVVGLLLHDLQHVHGAGLGADAAGDALGGVVGVVGLEADAEGAGLLADAAAHAQLLVDHVDALGVLGDGAGGAGLGAFAALHAHHGLRLALYLFDLDTGLVRVEHFIKRHGARLDALQAGHTFHILLYGQLFHTMYFSFI